MEETFTNISMHEDGPHALCHRLENIDGVQSTLAYWDGETAVDSHRDSFKWINALKGYSVSTVWVFPVRRSVSSNETAVLFHRGEKPVRSASSKRHLTSFPTYIAQVKAPP